jgi:hypothetical protein
LSILEAEEHSKRQQMEKQNLLAIPSHVSAPQADSWHLELEAARQREQQVRSSQPFAFTG